MTPWMFHCGALKLVTPDHTSHPESRQNYSFDSRWSTETMTGRGNCHFGTLKNLEFFLAKIGQICKKNIIYFVFVYLPLVHAKPGVGGGVRVKCHHKISERLQNFSVVTFLNVSTVNHFRHHTYSAHLAWCMILEEK